MTPLENTLKTYQSRLDEIRVHAEFIDQSVTLPHTLAPFLDRASLQQNQYATSLLEQHRRVTAQVRPEDMRAALLVQVFAATEWFVASTLLRAVAHYNSNTTKYNDLPDSLARTHQRLAGRALAYNDQARSHERLDTDQLCRRLGTCYEGSPEFHLNEDVFRLFLPNMDSAALSDSLTRVGFKLDWDKVGEDSDLQSFFELKSKRKAGKRCRELLDTIAEQRNVIAHRGDGSLGVDEAELKDVLGFLSVFARVIISQLTQHLSAQSKLP